MKVPVCVCMCVCVSLCVWDMCGCVCLCVCMLCVCVWSACACGVCVYSFVLVSHALAASSFTKCTNYVPYTGKFWRPLNLVESPEMARYQIWRLTEKV